MNESTPDGINRREAIKRTALMLGVAFSSSSITSALARAESNEGLGAGAKYLTASEYATIDALSETILPASDTPGARDVAVAAFADMTFGKYMSAGDMDMLRSGLATFEKASVAATGSSFAKLSSEKQATFLSSYSKDLSGGKRGFVRKVRELTLVGYFTSEEVAKNVLKYDPIPGDFVGCIDWEEGAANWAY